MINPRLLIYLLTVSCCLPWMAVGAGNPINNVNNNNNQDTNNTERNQPENARHRASQTRSRASPMLAMMESVENALLFKDRKPKWDHCEMTADGLDIMTGFRKFSVRSGDVLEVIGRYSSMNGGNRSANALKAKYFDLLMDIADGEIELMEEIDEDEFCSHWKEEARYPLFREAQIAVSTNNWLTPAIELSQQIGLKTPLGSLVLYDCMLDIGGEGEHKKLGTLELVEHIIDNLNEYQPEISRKSKGFDPSDYERAVLYKILKFRSTRKVRHLNTRNEEFTILRARALMHLLAERNYYLQPPLVLPMDLFPSPLYFDFQSIRHF